MYTVDMIMCEFEDGGRGSLRHVTVNTIVVQDDKILLAKRGTYGGGKPLIEMGKWSLLGGFVDRDEQLIEAAAREVMEESGWIIDNIQLFHIKDRPVQPANDRQNIEFVYIARAVQLSGTHDEEVQELRWYTLDQLPPASEIAFNHATDIELYSRYITEGFHIPVIGA